MSTFNWITNRHVVAVLCAAPILFSCAYALAEDATPAPSVETTAPAEPAPPYTLTYNLGLYSHYMFRGVESSDGPALQGGIDWAHNSGFYLGAWASNLDPYLYGKVDSAPGTNSRSGDYLEVDLYGGYAHTFENGFGINFLGNYYTYPEGHKSINNHSQNIFEASVALSYKYFTYTYYNALTDYYGFDKTDKNLIVTGNRGTRGADYNELKANYKLPIGDLNLMAKIGYQRTPHLQGSQGDFLIGLNRDFSLPNSGKPISGFNAGATYTDTFSVKNQEYYLANGRDTNENQLTFFVKRTW